MRCFLVTVGGLGGSAECRVKAVNWDPFAATKSALPSLSLWLVVTWELTPPSESPGYPLQPHSPSTAPRPRGKSRPKEYTAKAMRRVSTRSPSTIPASTPGLITEQLHPENVRQGLGVVTGGWELGGCVNRGRFGELREQTEMGSSLGGREGDYRV